MKFLPNSITVFYPFTNSEDDTEKNVLECGECSLDPTSEEEKSSKVSIIFTINPSEPYSMKKTKNHADMNEENEEERKKKKNQNNKNESANESENKIENGKFGIINMMTFGNFEIENLEESINLAKKSSLVLQEFVRRIIHDKMKIEA
jgi:RNA polymerase-binding transcription factor DksA